MPRSIPNGHRAGQARSLGNKHWQAILAKAEGAYADQTLRSYSSDIGGFSSWCRTHRRTFLPTSPETIADWLDGSTHLKPSTLRRRCAAIRKLHLLAGHADPTASEAVLLALRRARRSRPGRPHQALGLTAALRDRLVAACGDDLTGLRDRAMMSVGFDTLCRRAELVALRVEDVQPRSGGGAGILVRRAKNDADGNGRLAAISDAAWQRLCAWLNAAGIEEGPIFRPVYGATVRGRVLHPIIVSRLLKAAALRAGLDAATIAALSGHSLRVGCAQHLNDRGFDLLTIMRAGGWRSANVVARYVEKAPLNIWD